MNREMGPGGSKLHFLSTCELLTIVVHWMKACGYKEGALKMVLLSDLYIGKFVYLETL